MATYTKKELESMTTIYDGLAPKIQEFVKRGNMTMNIIKKELKNFGDSNMEVLQSEFIGKQILFTEKSQENILKTMGITEQEVGELMEESPYFKSFGKLSLDSQLRFAIPLLIASGEFLKVNKKAESELMFLIASYRPYATRCSRYFPYGINDDRMRYVVNKLTNRYDIKKYGTVYMVLEKKSETAYNNYKKDLIPPITDRNLHVIFNSGIYSRINELVKGIRDEYDKSEGEYMPFVDSTYEGTGDSEGEILARNISSDAAARANYVRKTVNTLMKSPINEKFLDIAAKVAFTNMKKEHGTYQLSSYYTDLLRSIVLSLVKEQSQELTWYVDSVLSHFMATKSGSGRFKASDIKGPQFIPHALRMITYSNTKDENILRVKESLRSFLENHSIDYVSSGNTKRYAIERALHMYLLLIIQKG